MTSYYKRKEFKVCSFIISQGFFIINPSSRSMVLAKISFFVSVISSPRVKRMRNQKIANKTTRKYQETKNSSRLFNDFFPELVEIQTHLEDYSICERHY